MQPTPVLKFTVHGTAQTAGSKRAFVPRDKKTGKPFERGGRIVTSVVDDNAKSKDWKRTVAQVAGELWGAKLLLTGPLVLKLTFYMVRPKNQYGSGRNSNVLKASAPAFPIGKPDVLKLARAVEDALSGVIYQDDAQIVHEVLGKRYGDRVGVLIEILTLPEAVGEVSCPA